MIRKVPQPTTKEFRPIAVTSAGGKLAWGLQKIRMEEHLETNAVSPPIELRPPSGHYWKKKIGKKMLKNILDFFLKLKQA